MHAAAAGLSFQAPIPTFLQWRKSQKKCSQKAHPALITAQFELKPPPYPLNALEPHMSRLTLEYHWGKHQRGYVENLNRQVTGTELDGMPIEDVILASYNQGDPLPAFNNAAQIWNHDFFWQSMKPDGGGLPFGDLLKLIERDFGSCEAFMTQFKFAAATHFGSGWTWLVYKENKLNVGNSVNPFPSEDDNKLVIVKSPNAVNPLVWDYLPLLAIDVWEHAYFIDYQNQRSNYVSIFMEKLISWEVVSSRLDMAKAQAAERAREDERKLQEQDELEMGDTEMAEMYLDSDSDESEVE